MLFNVLMIGGGAGIGGLLGLTRKRFSGSCDT